MKIMETKEQRNLLKTRTAVTALAVIAIVLFCWAILTGFILERTVLNEEYYQRIIETADLGGLKEQLMKLVVLRAENFMPEVNDSVRLALDETVNEDWIRKELFSFVKEYLHFIKEEREALLFEIDLARRREIFEKAFSEQIENRYAESLGEVGNDFLAGFLALVETPDKLVLVHYDPDEEMSPELSEARKGLNDSRVYLTYFPACGLVLTVVLLGLWRGAVGLLKWTGLGIALSGAGYILLWRVTWCYLLCPRIEGFTENINWLASIWEQENQNIYDLIARVINPAVIIFIGSGAILVVAGVFLKNYRIYKKC